MIDQSYGDFIQQLRCFYFAVEYSSISKAAVVLNKSQSSVSRQIQQLEEQLGVKLFWRESFGSIPTAEGEELYQRAVGIFKQIQGIYTYLGHHASESPLRVSVAPVAMPFFYSLLPQLAAVEPKQRFVFVEATGLSPILTMIENDTLDFALVQEENYPAPLQFLPLMETRFSLITPRSPEFSELISKLGALQSSRAVLADVGMLTHICLASHTAVSRFLNHHFSLYGLKLNVVHTCGSRDMQKQMVQAGFGAALVDEGLHLPLGKEVEKCHVFPLESHLPARRIGILFLKNKNSPLQQSIIDIIYAHGSFHI